MLCNIKSLTSRCLNDHDRWISVSQKHDRIGEVYRGYAKSTSNFIGGINRNFTTTWFSHVGCRRRIFEKLSCIFLLSSNFSGNKTLVLCDFMTWGRIDAKKERNNRRRLGAIWRNTRGDILHRPKIEKKKK